MKEVCCLVASVGTLRGGLISKAGGGGGGAVRSLHWGGGGSDGSSVGCDAQMEPWPCSNEGLFSLASQGGMRCAAIAPADPENQGAACKVPVKIIQQC